MDLSGKIALITGGARMGLAIGQALGRRGCRVILTWRNSRRMAEKTVAELLDQGIEATALRCDVSLPSSIQKLVRAIDRSFRRLDILVNMASNYDEVRLFKDDLPKAWENHVGVDARSSYLLSLAVAPLMRRRQEGRIVLLSDWLPASGRPRYLNHSGYYIAKAAVKAVTEALALELAPVIQVNAIAPGPILPPPSMSKKEHEGVIKATPLGRWGGPEEIAKAVLFLVETDFVTGETIRVDGGRHLL